MSETLLEKRKKMEAMQIDINIQKLEIRFLEIDEEKALIHNKIEEQKNKLATLQATKEDE